MTALITNKARAYVNFGRWIAECPYECGSARKLEPGETIFQCTECMTISPVDWPDNAQDLWDVLQERPIPRTRNWFPSGHDLAVRSGCEHGQTVAQLRAEAAEHMGG